MERTLKQELVITPGADGWCVDGRQGAFPTLKEAVAGSVAGQGIYLSLPCNAVLMEHLTLPALDREELAGMVRLQLEKTLPFSPEEMTSDFQILSQTEKESHLLSVAINNAQLDSLCSDLRQLQRLPEKISIFAMQVAASRPKDRLVLVIYRERDHLVVGLADHGKLAYAQTTARSSGEELASELPQLLLSATMEGIETGFSEIHLEEASSELQPALEKLLDLPVVLFSVRQPLPEIELDLLPEAWSAERQRISRATARRSQLKIAGAIYIGVLFLAFLYLFFLGQRVSAVNRKVAQEQPRVEAIKNRMARWNALAGAVDPGRSTVEILHQITSNRPSNELRITLYEQTREQFMLEGEAPSANMAIEFSEQLKQNPALSQFSFEIAPPTILPNEHAQMRIFGKL